MHQTKTHKTAIGEQKIVYLADGSIVHVDTNTTVKTSLTKKFRSVELISGKAFFSVAHEPDRPFIVKAGELSIRALGTEFAVYKKEKGEVSISVSKGRVQVIPEDEKQISVSKKAVPVLVKQKEPVQKLVAEKSDTHLALSKKILGPGQKMEVDKQKAEYVIKPVDVKIDNAWQEGRLNFQNKPLSDVIEELNRYVDRKITIGDNSLKNINVNVYFKIKNRKDFITTLSRAFPVISHTVSNGKIVLVKK